MLDKITDSLEKTNNVMRSSYIWNAANACVLAMQSPIIMMVLNRTNGVEESGIFSIALAVANLMLFLGQYGLRKYQSSDRNEDFTFAEYHATRIFTCALMVVCCLGYCFYGVFAKNYSWEKFTIIFLICILKLIQAYADVIHGRMQQLGRLDVAGKAATLRYSAELIVYVAVLFITHNQVAAISICLLVSIIIFMLTSMNAARRYCDTLKPSCSWAKFRLLMIEGFPLFVSLFLNMYLSNAPKYAIDTYLTDDIQAIYNMIFMPTFVIQLITQFIFNPLLTTYADLWLAKSPEKLKKMMKMHRTQIAIVAGLTVLALIVSITIAMPILSWFFGVDLNGYKKELCVIMLGGGMLALSVYLNTVIAVIRMQKTLLICYGTAALAALLLSETFVRNYGIMGAAGIYTVIMTILAAALFVVVTIRFSREKREVYSQGA